MAIKAAVTIKGNVTRESQASFVRNINVLPNGVVIACKMRKWVWNKEDGLEVKCLSQ